MFGGSPITSSVARPEAGCHVAPLRSETRSTANREPSLAGITCIGSGARGGNARGDSTATASMQTGWALRRA